MADTAEEPGWNLVYYGEQLREVERAASVRGLRFRQAVTQDGFIQWVESTEDEDAA